MRVRPIEAASDFSKIKTLWTERVPGAHAIDLTFSVTGLVVESEEDSGLLGAIFVYPILGCRVALIGFPVTSKNTTPEERSSVLELLFDSAHELARELNYKYIWTMSNVPPIQKRLVEEYGYVLGDDEVKQYWKEL